MVFVTVWIYYRVHSANGFEQVAHVRPAYVGNKKPSILLVCTAQGLGGAETNVFHLFTNLLQQGCTVYLLLLKGGDLEKKITAQRLSYYRCPKLKYKMIGITFHPGYYVIKRLCKRVAIDIIHCNEEQEIRIAKKVAHKLGIRVMLTRHIPNAMRKSSLQNIAGAIGVSKQISDYLVNNFSSQRKAIATIPPLFDDQAFLRFTPTENKNLFFKKHFGITLPKSPVFCMIANMYPDILHKNHHLLFHALHILIHEKQKSVHVMLAGDGPGRRALERLAVDLNIKSAIHFLGFTDKIADILYHTDFHVLSSSKEAFGIVLMEAALLKKPSIGARGTGVTNVIKHNQTGLLFKNKDSHDLARQIERYIDDPGLVTKLGFCAYEFVKKDFSVEAGVAKHVALYKNVCR